MMKIVKVIDVYMDTMMRVDVHGLERFTWRKYVHAQTLIIHHHPTHHSNLFNIS
jgi:hypothetical protein